MGKIKSIFQNLAVLSLSFFILIILLEALVRIFYSFQGGVSEKEQKTNNPEDLRPRFIYENNKEVGYRFNPNLKTTFKNIKKTRLITNSIGLRDREYGKKEKNVFRIVLLGDSFTFGWDVEAEMSYPKLLEKMLNNEMTGEKFEVMNCGVPGYGTDQEMEFLKKIALSFEPDLVLVGFYAGNDITDNMIGGMNRRSVKDGYLLDNYLHEKVSSENPYLKAIKSYFEDRSLLFALVEKRYERLALKLGYHSNVNPYYQLEVKQLDVFKKKYDKETEDGMEKTVKLIDEIRHLSLEKGAEMAVIFIPTFYQIYSKAWENYLSSYGLDASLYDPNKPDVVLNNYFENYGIKSIDLLELFRQYGKTENLYLFGHWNERGHVIASSAIFDYLKDKKLIRNKRFFRIR